MTTVQYICAECGRPFSYVETYEPKRQRAEAMCPFCGNRTLVLVHRETWKKKELEE